MPSMSIVVITFDGEIEDFPVLVQTIDNLVASGTQRLVLDLESLPFINSAALGYLIKVQKVMAGHGGEIVLARLRPALKNILEMTQLDRVLPAFESPAAAIEYHGGSEVRRQEWREHRTGRLGTASRWGERRLAGSPPPTPCQSAWSLSPKVAFRPQISSSFSASLSSARACIRR